VSRLNDFIISSSQANVGGRRGSEVKRERERTRREEREAAKNPIIQESYQSGGGRSSFTSIEAT
jgi:hypothetical protein